MRPASELSAAEVDQLLKELPGWRREGEVLVKAYAFGGFREAMSFMVRVGFEAEAAAHHPEIQNVYNRVVLRLNTHDAGNRITERDVALATAIERFNWVG